VPHAGVVLGHPTALPVGDEVYGYPPAWPKAFDPDPDSLAALRERCVLVRDAFTADWNAALKSLAPHLDPVIDAFAEHGDVLLLNYPQRLHDPARTALLPPHAFLGSAVRDDVLPDDVAGWLFAPSDLPLVYVSFGSFLSVRADVLARVVTALGAWMSGWRWPSGRPTARWSGSCRRTGWSGNSCRRWSSCAEPPWRSPTGATTV